MTVLEAMALARPVVATPVGALPDMLDAKTLVPVADVAALRENIAGLLSDPDRAASMGAAAREKVARDFTWPVIAERTIELYRDAVGRAAS